jgi:hypothetical protein
VLVVGLAAIVRGFVYRENDRSPRPGRMDDHFGCAELDDVAGIEARPRFTTSVDYDTFAGRSGDSQSTGHASRQYSVPVFDAGRCQLQMLIGCAANRQPPRV